MDNDAALQYCKEVPGVMGAWMADDDSASLTSFVNGYKTALAKFKKLESTAHYLDGTNGAFTMVVATSGDMPFGSDVYVKP